MGGDISVNQNMKLEQLREAVKDFDGGIAAKWDKKGGFLLYESKGSDVSGKLGQVQQSMKNSAVSPQAQALGKALFYEMLANSYGEKYADQIFSEFAENLFAAETFLTPRLIELAENRAVELVKNASMQGVQNQNEQFDDMSGDSDFDIMYGDNTGLTGSGDNVNVDEEESLLSKLVTNPENPNIGGNGDEIDGMDDFNEEEFFNDLKKYEMPNDEEIEELIKSNENEDLDNVNDSLDINDENKLNAIIDDEEIDIEPKNISNDLEPEQPVVSKENKNSNDVNDPMKLDEYDELLDDLDNVEHDNVTKGILAGSKPQPNTKPEKSESPSNVDDPMQLDEHDEIYEEELGDFDPNGNESQQFIGMRPEENKNVKKSGNDQNVPIQQGNAPKQTETKPNVPQRNENTRVRKTSRKGVSDPNEALAKAQKKLNDIGKKVNDGKKLLDNLQDELKANRLRQRNRLRELKRKRRTRSDETNQTTRSNKSDNVNSARQARYRKQLLRANRDQGWDFWRKVNDGGKTNQGIPSFGKLLEMARPDPKEDILVGAKIANDKQGRFLKKELRNAVLAAFENYPTRVHLLNNTQKTELAVKVMRARLSASTVANSMPN